MTGLKNRNENPRIDAERLFTMMSTTSGRTGINYSLK